MPPQMSNVVALCTGFCGIVLFTFLLRSGSLGAAAYSLLVAATLLASLAIARIEDLSILDLKNQRVTMREIQQVRTDVYAKAEELKKMAAGVASFAAANIVNENRLVDSGTHQERMLRRRDELSKFLTDAGLSDKQREDLLRPITLMADWDIRTEIVINAVAAWKPPPGTDPTNAAARDVMRRDLEAALQNPDRVEGLRVAEKLLNAHGVASDSLSQSLAQYRRMLDSGRLPKVGPADDLRRAPLL